MAETTPVNGGAPPRIDPTVLTTDAVNAAKEDLRRELKVLLDHRDEMLAGLRVEVLAELARVKDINDERLLRIDQRFEERDTRTEQIAQLGRISLDAALAAAKEAVGEQNKSNALSITKSESSMKEQVNANSTQAMTRIDALSDKIDDLKSRIDRGEGTSTGRSTERTEHRTATYQNTGIVYAIIAGVAVIAGTLIGVFH